MKTAKFEIKKSKNGQFYFVLKAKNGKIILQSETYVKKDSAVNTINSIVNIIKEEEFEIVDLT